MPENHHKTSVGIGDVYAYIGLGDYRAEKLVEDEAPFLIFPLSSIKS
jgi:hypothetical protein